MSELEKTTEREIGRSAEAGEVAGRDVSEFRLQPAVDICEDDDAIRLIADVPGVTTESLKLEVDDDVLTLEGDIELDMPERMNATFAEVRGSHYYRQFRLGREVDAENIRAEVRNGVLELLLPKQAQHRRRRIEIHSD